MPGSTIAANVSRTAFRAPSRRCAALFIAPASPGRSTWARFKMEGRTHRDDTEEEGFRFGDHAFKAGEYVSLREEDGELLTFRA